MLVLSGCIFLFLGPEVLYEETFSGSTADQWSLTDDDNITLSIEDGKYHFRFKSSETVIQRSRNIEQGPFDNFQIDADVTHISGENHLTALGVLFRIADWDNLYGFRIGPGGTYSIWKRIGGTFELLVDWTASDAINQGAATNHLTVQADRGALTFLINGSQVEQLSDVSIASGDIGVYARTYDGVTNAHMAFDNIVVTELE